MPRKQKETYPPGSCVVLMQPEVWGVGDWMVIITFRDGRTPHCLDILSHDQPWNAIRRAVLGRARRLGLPATRRTFGGREFPIAVGAPPPQIPEI